MGDEVEYVYEQRSGAAETKPSADDMKASSKANKVIDYRGKGGMYHFTSSETKMIEAAVRCRVESARENDDHKETERWVKIYVKHFGNI